MVPYRILFFSLRYLLPLPFSSEMINCGFLPRLRLAASPFKSGLLPASKRSPYSSQSRCAAGLEPPDVVRLAEAARISLSTQEVEEFGPKIRQVVDWFGQLQAVDLESIEPSLRASSEAVLSPREDTPETFDNREAIIEAIPSYDDPYIKVPIVLNKD